MTFNFINYKGLYETQAFSSLKLSTLSTWTVSSFVFMLLYPILVVAAFAGTYHRALKCGIYVALRSHVSRRKYIYTNIALVFSVSFLLFTLPFLLEIFVYMVSIPSSIAFGDPSNLPLIESIYYYDRSMIFWPLYSRNEYIYTIFMVLLFGGISGIFSCFGYVITMFDFCKLSITNYLPIFVLLELIYGIGHSLKWEFPYYYLNVLAIFGTITSLTVILYALIIVALMVAIVCICEWRIRKSVDL